jgi:flagellar protein FlaG
MEVIMGMAIASAGTRVAGLPAERISETARTRAGNIRASDSSARGLPDRDPVNRKILDITRNLEQISLSFNRRLQFVVDHQSNEITVKVIDRATDKVIKVLPPEELQRLHSRIEETIGFLFDETV